MTGAAWETCRLLPRFSTANSLEPKRWPQAIRYRHRDRTAVDIGCRGWNGSVGGVVNGGIRGGVVDGDCLSCAVMRSCWAEDGRRGRGAASKCECCRGRGACRVSCFHCNRLKRL